MYSTVSGPFNKVQEASKQKVAAKKGRKEVLSRVEALGVREGD